MLHYEGICECIVCICYCVMSKITTDERLMVSLYTMCYNDLLTLTVNSVRWLTQCRNQCIARENIDLFFQKVCQASGVSADPAEKLQKSKIKSSLYSLYYAEACNEWRGPSPRLSAWATQLRRNVAAVASRWRHCADLTGPGIEPQTSRTESVRLATELTAG